MKSSWNIDAGPGGKFQPLLDIDRAEIDNPDPHHRTRLFYHYRIEHIVALVKHYFPEPAQTKIGEFGCYHGNISLLLAEAGYRTYAIDINPTYLEYSKLKYETGAIQWIQGNLEQLEFPENSLDLAVMGESITLFAYPERALGAALRFVRPGGLLMVTTVNGSQGFLNLPTLRELRRQGRQEELVAAQHGFDNMYRLTMRDLEKMTPKNAVIVHRSYCGSTRLINKYSQNLIRPIPLSLLKRAVRILAHVPVLNRKTFVTMCVIFKKE